MSEYWTEKDVMENAILDLQHERDDLQAELARLCEDKSNNVLLITKLRSVVAGRDQTISEMAIEISQLQQENACLREELYACQSALKSMVYQYLYRPLDLKTKEPCENVYQHDFMSAGEEACDYLVRYGLASWTDKDKYAIRFIQKETE